MSLFNKKEISIQDLWREHRKSLFPKGYGGIDINGICISSLDTYVSGCISTYVNRNDGMLDLDRMLILRKSKIQLESILKLLEDDALIYFGRLHELTRLIVNEAKII